jgi:hypothetical protein
MVKLAIVAAILPAAAWWWTTNFCQAATSEPAAYALYLAKSAAYLTSRSNDARELTDISHCK